MIDDAELIEDAELIDEDEGARIGETAAAAGKLESQPVSTEPEPPTPIAVPSETLLSASERAESEVPPPESALLPPLVDTLAPPEPLLEPPAPGEAEAEPEPEPGSAQLIGSEAGLAAEPGMVPELAPEAEPEPKAEPALELDLESELEAEVEPEAERGLEPAPEAERGLEPALEAERGLEPALEAEPGPEPALEAEAEPEAEPGPEPALEAESELEAEAGPEPALEAEAEPEAEAGPEPALEAESELEAEAGPEPALEPEAELEAEPPAPSVGGVSLAEVQGLEDLPEDAQQMLVDAARLETLQTDEEVSAFGVALVVRGRVSIMPTIADVACARAGIGDVVFTVGTLEEGVALRVVASEDDTEVAIWDREALEQATAGCPWVADELRLVADRYQALAGATMGELGERLDDTLRDTVTGRCEVRTLEAGELVVEHDEPVTGIHIVGAGRLELVGSDGEVLDELGPGDFLFSTEVMAAGPAPATARAGAGGALLLFAGRHVAHELMVSVPPLLEILAG